MNGWLDTLRRNRVLAITLAILVLLFLLAIQGMSTEDWVVTLLRGLAVGAITFLVAAGFSIILGLMDVLNLAHGTLFMIGAYVGWSVFVRPDTFVDALVPFALVLSGFVLLPIWESAVGRFRLPQALARVWPWVGLALAGVLLAATLVRAPLAVWDHEVYTDSPVVWTQNFQRGLVAEQIVPARFEGVTPLVGLAGLLLVGLLGGLSVAGLRAWGRPTAALHVDPRTIVLFAGLVLLGLGVYTVNDALTQFLFNISTTWLFLISMLVATLVGAGLGALIEITLIRPLYERPIYQIMLTFGLGFIGTEVVRAVWGRTGFIMPRPAVFAGSGEGCPATGLGDWLRHRCSTLVLTIGGESTRIRVYNEIFVILVGLVVLVTVWVLLRRSRLGMIIRAGVQDRDMVEALGINVRRVFTLVFALGVGLAALGGVIAAPSMGLSDAMGVNLLLGALIALAIGGLTSYPGAAAGSLLVGLLQQFIIKYGQIGIALPFMAEPFKPSPPLVPASTVLLMVVILLIMPQGLFGRRE